jgi:hypothetical protein
MQALGLSVRRKIILLLFGAALVACMAYAHSYKESEPEIDCDGVRIKRTVCNFVRAAGQL